MPRLLRLLSAAAMLAAAGVAASSASAAEGSFFFLGEDLLKACTVSPKGDWADDVRIGTFAQATSDAQELFVSAGGTAKFCLPEKAQRSDLGSAVCDYLKTHPDRRKFSGMALTVEALAAKYPCGH